jgi:large conductance mechanosensitive channel
MVNDILMPIVSLATGKVDFSNLFVALNGQHYETLADAKKAAAPTLNYGLFINTVIEFVIIALVIFLVVKQVNRLMKPAPAPATSTKPCPECCTAIPLGAKRCPACTSVLAS